MLQHAQSHKRIYQATVGRKSGPSVMQHMHDMITDLARDEIAVLFPDPAA